MYFYVRKVSCIKTSRDITGTQARPISLCIELGLHRRTYISMPNSGSEYILANEARHFTLFVRTYLFIRKCTESKYSIIKIPMNFSLFNDSLKTVIFIKTMLNIRLFPVHFIIKQSGAVRGGSRRN